MRRSFRLAAVLLASVLGGGAGADDVIQAQRAAAHDRYRDLLAEGRNTEAVAAGLDVVMLTKQLHGEASPELASPLTNLATAQLRNGDLRDAESSYQAAIDILVKHEGFLSMRLVNPLLGLGEAYVRDGQYALATETYERALHINHVNEGLYNPDQVAIRDGLTEGYLGLLDLEMANLHQDAQVYAKQRRLDANDPALVEAYTKLGRWYDRSKQPELARLAYQSAARLTETIDGEESPALVDLMLELARTYRDQALLPANPDSSQSPANLLALSGVTLKKALNAAEAADPPDPAQLARVHVELGDLNLVWGKRNSAMARYRDAWQALSANPDLEDERNGYFAEPSRIFGPVAPGIYPEPSRKAPAPAGKRLEPGFVVVRFDVDASGRVVAPTVIEADPANLIEEQVADALAKSLFRPRIVDGAPVVAAGLIARHEFRYAPDRLEKKDGEPADRADQPLEQPTSGDGS